MACANLISYIGLEFVTKQGWYFSPLIDIVLPIILGVWTGVFPSWIGNPY